MLKCRCAEGLRKVKSSLNTYQTLTLHLTLFVSYFCRLHRVWNGATKSRDNKENYAKNSKNQKKYRYSFEFQNYYVTLHSI